MTLKNLLSVFSMLLLFFVNTAAEAETMPFTSGSYQKLLTDNANQPFVLVVWSVDCPSCLKDMALISSIHKNKPELKLIMLAADDLSASGQIEQILEKNALSELEHWAFADGDAQKLRFEIDPKWYGELPRTYFFDKTHQRTAVSGALAEDAFNGMLAKILE